MPDWLVDPDKILRYLLNKDSPSGMAKARFFQARGFRREDWPRLRDALIGHPRSAELAEVDATSPYGTKRVFVCGIAAPDGGAPCIRTVWQQRNGDHWLVTAYPFG